MKNWMAGKKYDDLLGKKANIRGKRWTKEEKGQIFTLFLGKISFLRGGGAKISYFGQIYTPE